MRGWSGEAGASCASGWSEVQRQPGPAPVFQLPALPGRAALHAAAAFGATPPVHQHGDAAQPPFMNAPIQPGTSIGPHAALDVVTDFRLVVHGNNLWCTGHSCQTNALTRLSGRAHS